jgi:hypothetical protein
LEQERALELREQQRAQQESAAQVLVDKLAAELQALAEEKDVLLFFLFFLSLNNIV